MIVVADATPLIALAKIGHFTLLQQKRQGYIAKIRPLLDDLQSRQFHLNDRVYNAVLHQAGESPQ